MIDKLKTEERIVELVRLEVLTSLIESIIMISKLRKRGENITLRKVLVEVDEYQDDKLKNDILGDSFLLKDKELIIYIFTSKISSSLYIVFHSSYMTSLKLIYK